MIELLRVDNNAIGTKGDRAPRETRARPARDGPQTETRDGPEEGRHLGFCFGSDHGQGQIQTPIGGVGGVGDKGERIEADIAGSDDISQRLLQTVTLSGRFFHVRAEGG